MSALESVHEYHLSGDAMNVDILMKDDNEIELAYKDQQGDEQRFSGRAVYREKTQLGLLLSVLLEAVPDLKVVSFSVVVPAANRPENMRSVPISTFAVRTVGRTSIGGPNLVQGQLEEYTTIPLTGNAW